MERPARSLATIQTCYALAADAPPVVDEETLETGPQDPPRPSEAHPAEGSSLAEVGPASPTRGKGGRCRRRARKKKLVAEANGGVCKTTVKRVAQKRAFSLVEGKSFTLTNAVRGDLKAAEGGWLGSRKKVPPEKESTLEELIACGFKLVEWDGVTPHALLDASGHVIAVLAGRPTGTFENVLREATSEFKRNCISLPPEGTSRRGHFHTVVTGISYGGGQPVPMQSAVPKVYQNAVHELRASKAMHRLAGFQNQAFKTFFSDIHGYYEDKLWKLYRSSPHLRPPYETSIMPAAAYNLGPATVCIPHRDSANLSFGICVITALGRFNPKTGGHLVLRELGLVIEFPPGATVLIPSAVLTHYNLKISEGETRYSFTQYAAGSLFCYIENGMRPEQDLMGDQKLSPVEKKRHVEARRARWSHGVALFPHISDYRGSVDVCTNSAP